jgi:hypothetical protein
MAEAQEKREDLIDSREILFLVWLRETSRVRQPLREVVQDVLNHLPYVPLNQTGTRLSLSFAQFLSQRINEGLQQVFGVVDADIRDGAQRAIARAIRTQVRFLKQSGIAVPDAASLQKIADSVFGKLTGEFPPGSGVTYRQRLNRTLAKHNKQAKSILTRAYRPEETIDKISKDLTKGLVGPRKGQRAIPGGSASAKLSRIKVAEEARLANIAEVQVARTAGLELGYWRRRGHHRCGTGICVTLAEQIGSGVLSALDAMNIRPGSVDLHGLYLLSDWPYYPHPYCQCYPEPFFIPKRLQK